MSIRVLIVDDDSATTDLLRLMLKRESFDVVVANNGEDGIKAARDCSPDVIVLDLLMPGEDGLETCKMIRGFSQVPILVLSALDNPGLVNLAFNEGADDFLIKPALKDVLVAHLNTLARRAKAENHAVAVKNGKA